MATKKTQQTNTPESTPDAATDNQDAAATAASETETHPVETEATPDQDEMVATDTGEAAETACSTRPWPMQPEQTIKLSPKGRIATQIISAMITTGAYSRVMFKPAEAAYLINGAFDMARLILERDKNDPA